MYKVYGAVQVLIMKHGQGRQPGTFIRLTLMLHKQAEEPAPVAVCYATVRLGRQQGCR